MPDGNDWENAFREWIQSNEMYLDVRIPHAGLEDRLLSWYKTMFAENGAMPGPLLTELMLRTKRRILPHALEVVQSDVSLTLGQGLRMTLEEGPGDVPGAANNIFLLGNSLLAMTEEDV